MRKIIFRNQNLLRLIAFFSLVVFSFITSAFVVEAKPLGLSTTGIEDVAVFEGNYDWETTLSVLTSNTDYITYTEYRNNYCNLAATPQECSDAAAGKKIRFDTAEGLYRFSIDVSFEQVYQSTVPTENYKLSEEKIAVLLSLDYVLGKNIDYSVMGSKTFIPIGYSFSGYDELEQPVFNENIFTGSFDGQGFAISNLYVAGYEYLVSSQTVGGNTVDIALSSYYSMFPFNDGVIKNFGLLNPTFELLNLHIDIDKVSNVVGINLSNGVVDHVYVIDSRTDVLEAGIRYKVGTSSEVFEAAGLVHTNAGIFTNSYYVSKVVVNGNYINKFNIQPVLYLNTGTYSNLVYDSEVYLLEVVVGTSTFTIATPNAYATGEITSVLKSDASSLNTLTDDWHFYEDDCYPLLQGLEYSNNAYLITSAIDLQFFSRVLAFVTENNGVAYAYADYEITDDIDMGVLATTVYTTPNVTFYGSLTGFNDQGTDLSDNFYIYNLTISTGILRGTLYYAGLFSVIGSGASVNNLNFNESTISLTNTATYYSSVFYVGAIAGRMTGGIIEDVIVDVDINMGTGAIGETHVGGIVGQASGVINEVSSSGTINMNTHTFLSTYNIAAKYYIGGIVGSADQAQLVVTEAVNHGTLYGFGTSSTFYLASGTTAITVKMGGVVGYILNLTTAIHQFVNVANMGDLYVNSVTNTVSLPSNQRIGGVFGELTGVKPVLETGPDYQFANLYNSGTIHASYVTETSVIKAAGIGITNTSVPVEYALLFNYGTFIYNTTGATYTNQLFQYTGTIFDIGTQAVTLSRVYNHGDFVYDSSYYVNISPLYRSDNNNTTIIRYSANYGDVTFWKDSGLTVINLATTLSISGITTSTNVNFLNVSNYGTLSVVNVNVGTNALYLSGITKTLTSGKYIKNSLNEGNLVFAKMTGTGILLVGGITNTNLSGDLQSETQNPTLPIATIGIINTINYGNITTSYGLEAQNIYGVNGLSNTFASGIATLNAGSIQDAANLGDVTVYNSNSSATATFLTDQTSAGLISIYAGGVVVGGVVAATLSGDARVYDTGNNGDIVAKSYRFARAGGVLGVSLYAEAYAGGITAGMGLLNTIQLSVLSNGLNFGNVSALTVIIKEYTEDTPTNQSFEIIYGAATTYGAVYSQYTTTASQERPEINASAGGVIGYGLSVMRRMLNHGTVSSTDVAGGVVGATYALGSETTIVHINTAINYGNIRAVPAGDVSSINSYSMSYSDISSYFMDIDDIFLYPTGYTVEEPRGKRGFGGIFGRLQRGLSGIMTSVGGEFDFIVNADPDVDLIGRLDQVYNFSSSSRFFRFNDAVYYSAKVDDTTQAVFTGFNLGYFYEITSYTGYSRNWSITATNYVYEQVGIVIEKAVPNVIIGTYSYTSTSRSTPVIGTLLSTPTPYYIDSIDVPWITEDEFDPLISNSDTEYMYDADFEMRVNPDLTEYIYFMGSTLLADRFQDELSPNYRPDGMYVLSTTAGSTYGAVLPANINTDEIRPIDEDYASQISLLIDYANVSVSFQADLNTLLISKYDDLRQTIFNEKSELIASGTELLILTENDGSDTILANADIDNDNFIITYTISMEAFSGLDLTANYAVTNAFTSLNALVAEKAEDAYDPDPVDLLEYRTLLYPERYDGISMSFPALLEITLPSKDIVADTAPMFLGYLTVYSEAFIGSLIFASSNYYTDYEVYIIFTPGISGISTGTIGIDSVQFNGGSTFTATNPEDVRSLGDVTSAGSIRFNFEDTKGILTLGYDFKDYFVLRYSNDDIIPSSYYTVLADPVTITSGTGYYSITFTFYGNLRSADYHFEYRYFSSSATNTVLFDKAASSAKTIIDFDYYSEDDSISIVGTTITSYISLGALVSITALTDNFTENIDGGIVAYLSNATYDISYMYDDTLSLSKFASVTSARLVSTTYNSGYKTYQIEIIIKAEDNSTQIYTHNLIERSIGLVSVLTNGNDTDLEDVFALREDDFTVFTVDLGLDQNLNLYNIIEGSTSYFDISITATSLDGLTTYLEEDIVGITFSTGDYLYITMSYSTIPGIYTFSGYFYRDGTAYYVSFVDTLDITKLAGTDAYLTDIRFSDLANETSYPTIRITDEFGAVNEATGLDPRVYFAGIDYDGANTLGYRYFRVDGQVSNVTLNDYVPFMLNYIPYGATLSRHDYDLQALTWSWTTEVDINSDPAEKNELITDYTLMPLTGEEPVGEQEVVIQYRVTSEDRDFYTYYYVTVTDVTYNVTLIFDVYYCSGEPEVCTLASESVDFSDKLAIISVKNLMTDGDDSVINVENPDDYPEFTEITGLYNQMSQFYLTTSENYRYSFGRNRGGFYVFDVELPLDAYLNDLYTYEIEFLEYTLYETTDFNLDLVSEIEGKYFYIEYATKNRSRRFNIYIREANPVSTDAPWGLFDFFRSWAGN
ncbi:MAG: hypothetical protein KJ971_04325 [Firmicutes bacterium]|nr:hypothetical protein [Bacillota bacterium]